jgi:N-acetylneuraminic acid mutarotase
MKTFLTSKRNVLYISIGLMFFYGTSHANYWTQKASFPGLQIYGGFSFSIAGKGYIGCGYQYDDMNVAYKQFWMYDPVTNSWSQKADFAGVERYFASGIAINGKGYAGLGRNQLVSVFNDWYEYDPVGNAWTQKSSCPLVNVEAAESTTDFGYIITSTGATAQYNPLTDTWQNKAPFPLNLDYIKTFSIGNYIYAGMGYNNQTGTFNNSFYVYDESNNAWQQKATFPGAGRFTGANFSIGQKGYFGLGFGTQWPLYYTDFWEYNPVTDQWGQAASYPGVPREGFLSFSTSTHGYAGIGAEFTTTIPLYFNDFWEYTPGPLVNVEENAKPIPVMKINPNIVSSVCNIFLWNLPSSQSELIVTDVTGKVVFRKWLTENMPSLRQETIHLTGYSQGIYYVMIMSEKFSLKEKFVKVN